jgi:hypothetical protein
MHLSWDVLRIRCEPNAVVRDGSKGVDRGFLGSRPRLEVRRFACDREGVLQFVKEARAVLGKRSEWMAFGEVGYDETCGNECGQL